MIRQYEKTHAWITFSLRLGVEDPKLWMMLGECQSKVQHLANVPLRPTTHRELHTLYLAKGIQATTAIEGNTLSEEQVRAHLEGKLSVPPSQEYLQQEIENVRRACNRIVAEISRKSPVAISRERLEDLNKLVLAGLDLEDEVVPGTLREHSVTVGTVYRGAPAEDLPYLMERMCTWLEGEDFEVPDELAEYSVVYGLLKAILAHLYLAWIHPFGDGNGRTARLVEFQILLSAGVPAPAAHLLSNHYNQTRAAYYRQLDRASKSGGDVVPFIRYAVQGFLDGLREQLDFVWKQNWDIVWRNYVHELFKDKRSEAEVRRRHLALDLSRESEPVSKSAISRITPRIAEAYAGKTNRTVARDLNELEKLQLIERTPEGRFRACTEIVFSFLPAQVSD